MTLETLMIRFCGELSWSIKPIDVDAFLASYFLRDIEAGQLLIQALNARLFRGRLRTNLADFDGHITAQGTG